MLPVGDRPGGRGPGGSGIVLAAASLHAALVNQPALAAKKKEEESQEVEKYVEEASALLLPILSNLGFSGVMGMAAAAALKVCCGG